jgi:hypothetical protein
LFAPLADKLSGAERVVVLSEEETVKEVIVREPLKFVSDLLVLIVLETVIVQSAYVPTLRELKVMVLLPEIAEVVLEEHEPP